MTPMPITATLAALLAIWLLVLTIRVIGTRRSAGVSLGDGNDVTLMHRNRAQGNLTEFAPSFILVSALTELQGGNAILLTILAVMFLVGRLAHGWALSFSEKSPTGRIGGMFLTLVASGLGAVLCLWTTISAYSW